VRAYRCPLLGVKRTSRFQGAMSAFDSSRTSTRPQISAHRVETIEPPLRFSHDLAAMALGFF
jgi:hypothetical protein